MLSSFEVAMRSLSPPSVLKTTQLQWAIGQRFSVGTSRASHTSFKNQMTLRSEPLPVIFVRESPRLLLDEFKAIEPDKTEYRNPSPKAE